MGINLNTDKNTHKCNECNVERVVFSIIQKGGLLTAFNNLIQVH